MVHMRRDRILWHIGWKLSVMRIYCTNFHVSAPHVTFEPKSIRTISLNQNPLTPLRNKTYTIIPTIPIQLFTPFWTVFSSLYDRICLPGLLSFHWYLHDLQYLVLLQTYLTCIRPRFRNVLDLDTCIYIESLYHNDLTWCIVDLLLIPLSNPADLRLIPLSNPADLRLVPRLIRLICGWSPCLIRLSCCWCLRRCNDRLKSIGLVFIRWPDRPDPDPDPDTDLPWPADTGATLSLAAQPGTRIAGLIKTAAGNRNYRAGGG